MQTCRCIILSLIRIMLKYYMFKYKTNKEAVNTPEWNEALWEFSVLPKNRYIITNKTLIYYLKIKSSVICKFHTSTIFIEAKYIPWVWFHQFCSWSFHACCLFDQHLVLLPSDYQTVLYYKPQKMKFDLHLVHVSRVLSILWQGTKQYLQYHFHVYGTDSQPFQSQLTWFKKTKKE